MVIQEQVAESGASTRHKYKDAPQHAAGMTSTENDLNITTDIFLEVQ